ncbi:MAG: helix-turn-helix transcriptional regulator [Gammaproteobacteria bacterium]|jgi:transcriptional regulator with XRE-family HTH domain|nr:helix-turn-helix transcriptional regulator [Gammaproteobacteria bacterium]
MSQLTCPIARRLKEARIAASLSQKQLGIKAGIDQFSASARMNQYETGKHVPDFGTVKKIAQVLKLPTAYFYAEEDDLALTLKGYQAPV